MNKYSIVAPFLLLSADVFSSSGAGWLGQSVYILELLVIGLIAVALLAVTLSIAKSRKRLASTVTDIREEMGQERVALSMTMQAIKEKEEQITYMAHLLQSHMETGSVINNPDLDTAKKKVDHEEVCVEVLDEGSSEAQANTASSTSYTRSDNVDPRMVSADGSIKQAHFGRDKYLIEVGSYHSQAVHRLHQNAKLVNDCLANAVNDIHYELTAIQDERNRIRDFVAMIQSDRHTSAGDVAMNAKDKKLVNSLVEMDGSLKILQDHYQTMEKGFEKARKNTAEYTSLDIDNDEVEFDAISAV